LAVLNNEGFDAVQFRICKSTVLAECYWIEPVLGNVSVALYVDVRRLSAIGTEKHEAIGTDSKHRWHGDVL